MEKEKKEMSYFDWTDFVVKNILSEQYNNKQTISRYTSDVKNFFRILSIENKNLENSNDFFNFLENKLPITCYDVIKAIYPKLYQIIVTNNMNTKIKRYKFSKYEDVTKKSFENLSERTQKIYTRVILDLFEYIYQNSLSLSQDTIDSFLVLNASNSNQRPIVCASLRQYGMYILTMKDINENMKDFFVLLEKVRPSYVDTLIIN